MQSIVWVRGTFFQYCFVITISVLQKLRAESMLWKPKTDDMITSVKVDGWPWPASHFQNYVF